MDIEKKEFYTTSGIVFIALAIFLSVLFGFSGLKISIALLVIILPFFMLLDGFDIHQGEKAVFGTAMGVTVFPSLVYMLGLVISFKLSIFIVFIFVISSSFTIKKLKKKP